MKILRSVNIKLVRSVTFAVSMTGRRGAELPEVRQLAEFVCITGLHLHRLIKSESGKSQLRY